MNPNLEMQVKKTQVGVYTVTFGYKEAPLDVQEAAFEPHGLHMVSPAEKGFLCAKQQEGDKTFNPYSRTNTDVLFDYRTSKFVILPNEAISKLIGLSNLVDAHRRGEEYIIPESQRDLVYAMVDEMLKKGTAIFANHGTTEVETSKLGQDELTSRLFSDSNLGIQAQDYGDWQKSQGRPVQIIYFDNADYARSQKGPYANRLRIHGPGGGFFVYGYGWFLGGNYGAFAVRFEKTAEGGAKKQ